MTDHWWVIVCDVPRGSSPAAWLVGWLPTGHRHLWLARRIDDHANDDCQVWQVLDPAAHGLLSPVRIMAEDYIGPFVSSGCVAIKVPIASDPGRAYIIRGIGSCVSLAKYATGQRWPWVWTPGQFVKRAEREGFEIRRPADVRL